MDILKQVQVNSKKGESLWLNIVSPIVLFLYCKGGDPVSTLGRLLLGLPIASKRIATSQVVSIFRFLEEFEMKNYWEESVRMVKCTLILIHAGSCL